MALGGSVDVLATEDPDAIAEEHEELQIYEKHNNLLHGSKRKKYAHIICPGKRGKQLLNYFDFKCKKSK